MKWGDSDAYLINCADITEYKRLLCKEGSSK